MTTSSLPQQNQPEWWPVTVIGVPTRVLRADHPGQEPRRGQGSSEPGQRCGAGPDEHLPVLPDRAWHRRDDSGVRPDPGWRAEHRWWSTSAHNTSLVELGVAAAPGCGGFRCAAMCRRRTPGTAVRLKQVRHTNGGGVVQVTIAIRPSPGSPPAKASSCAQTQPDSAPVPRLRGGAPKHASSGILAAARLLAGLTLIVAGLGAAPRTRPTRGGCRRATWPDLANPSSTPSDDRTCTTDPVTPLATAANPGPSAPSLAPAAGAISLPLASPPLSLDFPAIHARIRAP